MYGSVGKKPTFALVALLFGSFAALLGLGIICGGGFNSVMQDPKGGPYAAATGGSATTVGSVVTVSGTTLNSNINLNNGHFLGLLKQYPELFNWSDLEDIISADNNVLSTSSGLWLPADTRRESSTAYTKRHAGENSWIFALYFPFALLLVVLGFVAFFRKSGYTSSLVGLALSAFMISFTLLIVIHYQAKSFVPQSLDAFTDCSGYSTASFTELRSNVQFGSVNGPAPRRPWLCRSEWSYDNDLRTAANLVYGGAATSFVGYISLLIGFAYLIQPFVVPTPNFAKAPLPASSSYRGADVDFDDYSEYYTDEE
jgi:hypothetical protein